MNMISPEPREPNGRKQRDPSAIRKDDVRHTAVNQPHRRGNIDQLCENALGRFVIRRKLRRELFLAGEEYRSALRRWRLAKGLKDEGSNGGKGTGIEAPREVILALAVAFGNAQKYVLREAGQSAFYAVQSLVIEGEDIGFGMDTAGAATDGLFALAVYYGFLKEAERG
jgi:hypothetical protein